MVSLLVLALADADDLRDDAADFGGGVELALALAALGGEVPHQVFVGVAEDVVALGAVLREIERRILEDGDEVGEPVHHLLAAAELCRVVEVRACRTACWRWPAGAMIFLLIWSPMSGLPLSATMSSHGEVQVKG